MNVPMNLSIVYSSYQCTMSSLLSKFINAYVSLRKQAFRLKPLSALGPEHEFSIVDEQLKPLSISDVVLRDYSGKIQDVVYDSKFAFGREAVLHQLEIKSVEPFESPNCFEDTMYSAVLTVSGFLNKHYRARLLGTGMHPTLLLKQTSIWPHTCQEIYQEYDRLFNLVRHGWRNTQSFQLNLPYYNEQWGVGIYNALSHLCAYLPALTASSPIIEGNPTTFVDNRLVNYRMKTKDIPSIAGDLVPERIDSFEQLREETYDKYSVDLARFGASDRLTESEWINQRLILFRFSRRALEVRVMDEQECIKADVALSCFIRSAVRGLMAIGYLPSHDLLVGDYNRVVSDGLNAKVLHPQGKTAREVCWYFYKIAAEYAKPEEKKYFWVVKKRLEEGNLSDIVQKRISIRSNKTALNEAILSVYLQLTEALLKNEPYF